jgi:hypothetical protein
MTKVIAWLKGSAFAPQSRRYGVTSEKLKSYRAKLLTSACRAVVQRLRDVGGTSDSDLELRAGSKTNAQHRTSNIERRTSNLEMGARSWERLTSLHRFTIHDSRFTNHFSLLTNHLTAALVSRISLPSRISKVLRSFSSDHKLFSLDQSKM